MASAQEISNSDGDLSQYYTLSESDTFGYSSTSIGDLDGDGATDLVVGAPEDDDGGDNCGAIYVLFLTSAGTVKIAQKISNSYGDFPVTLDPTIRFGRSVASLGDLDGDSVADLAVGANRDGTSTEGSLYILFLTTDGLVNSAQKIGNSYGNFPYVLDDSDYFGISCSSLGDQDGDGTPDLVVGSAQDDDDGSTNAGSIYIVFLTTSGLVKSAQKVNNLYGSFPYTVARGDRFGFSTAGIGDLDGDGSLDLVVGSKGEYLCILFLTTDGIVKSAQKIGDSYGSIPLTPEEGDYFGISVTFMGDLNEDGVPDLAVGAQGYDNAAGALYILFMTTDGMVNSAENIGNSYGNFPYTLDKDDEFGSSTASLEDLDGNGMVDLVVGAGGNVNGGAVYIIFLPSACPTPTPTTRAPSPLPSSSPTLSFQPSATPSFSLPPTPAPTTDVPSPIPTSVPTETPRPTTTPTHLPTGDGVSDPAFSCCILLLAM